MRPRLTPVFVLLLASLCVAEEPFAGVQYRVQNARASGAPMHVLVMDTTSGTLKFHVSTRGPVADRDAGGWQTTLAPVAKLAERDGLDVAVNGDYFASEPAGDADSADGLALIAAGGKYREGARARVMGAAVTDGKQWAMGPEKKPTFMVGKDGKVSIAEVREAPAGVEQAIGGNLWLVHEGKGVRHNGAERNARTAVGIDREGKHVIIVVVEGLKEGKASGVSVPELVEEMVGVGCYYAINLDGGGSTTLWMRDREGKGRVINRPTDGRARAVASVLGIRVGR